VRDKNEEKFACCSGGDIAWQRQQSDGNHAPDGPDPMPIIWPVRLRSIVRARWLIVG